MTWDDLARENYAAARELLVASYPRACIGRCYYSVYCAVAARLANKGMTSFTKGSEVWQNPPHEKVPGLVRNNLGLAQPIRDATILSIDLLRLVRVDADYRPWLTVDLSLAADAVREATLALSFLGVVR